MVWVLLFGTSVWAEEEVSMTGFEEGVQWEEEGDRDLAAIRRVEIKQSQKEFKKFEMEITGIQSFQEMKEIKTKLKKKLPFASIIFEKEIQRGKILFELKAPVDTEDLTALTAEIRTENERGLRLDSIENQHLKLEIQ